MIEITEKENTAQIEQIKGQIIPLKTYAMELVVNSPETLTQAGQQRLVVKEAMKLVDNYFDPDIARAHELHKSQCAKKKVFTDGLKEIDGQINQKMVTYRLEEQRKIDIAKAKADKEQRDLQEKAEAKAKELIKKGRIEEAQAVVENVKQVAAPVPEATKVEGVSKLIETYHAEIVDVNKIPRNYLVPDMSALNGVGKATNGTAKIPGVRFVKTVSQRTVGRR